MCHNPGLERTEEEIGTKISEFFVDRDDRLTYHSCKLNPSAALPAQTGSIATQS